MAKILFSIYILLSLRPLLFPHIYTQVYTKLINTNSNNTKKKKKSLYFFLYNLHKTMPIIIQKRMNKSMDTTC